METVAPEDWPCESLTVIVNTDGLDDVEYRKAARDWLEGVADALAGDLLGRYLARDETVAVRAYVGWGADDDVSQVPNGSVRVAHVLDQIGHRGRPELILLTAEEESDNGFRIPGSPGQSFSASLRVTASNDVLEAVSFHAVVTYWSSDGRIPALVQKRWLDVCARFCDDLPVSFGSVSKDDGVGETALDMALGRSESESVRVSRSVLRGYSWVTVCPGEIVERLGGIANLEASGSFWRIQPLASGAVWMQACEYLDEYGPAAIERVFKTLAPVLPSGVVEPTLGNNWPNLFHADAAQYDDGRRS